MSFSFTSLGLGSSLTGLVTGGLTTAALPAATAAAQPKLSTNVTGAPTTINLDPTVLAQVKDVSGNTVKQSPMTAIDLGQGRILEFDTGSLSARVTPVLDPTAGASAHSDGEAAFSGAACRLIIEFPHTPKMNGGQVQNYLGKQLLEASGITVSTHRAKSQVRPFGYINPKGVARGSRTIAGTLILNKFTTEILYRFLQSALMADVSKDTVHLKLDQLPPFNITMLFSNEQGFVSTQSLFGVEFVTDGTANSVSDIFIEQTLSYLATDMTPLVPLNFDTLFKPSTDQSGSSSYQKTVSSLWNYA